MVRNLAHKKTKSHTLWILRMEKKHTKYEIPTLANGFPKNVLLLKEKNDCNSYMKHASGM